MTGRLYSVEDVKERISLRDLFTNDGHVLKKAGSTWKCRCPRHEEKTSSCVIHEDEGYFKCFGCDFKGDALVYWQTTRGVDFKAALEALAAIAGLTGSPSNYLAPAKYRPKPEAAETLAPVLNEERLQQWEAATARLAEDGEQIARIGGWRGYSEALVRWAAESGLMGMLTYMGALREAFLIERPDVDAQDVEAAGLVPVGWHIRLGPNSPGNDHRKASWRYPWAGIGSWPFVVGSVATAKVLFMLEGQWDALALIDLMGWFGKWPKGVAVVGLRGATSSALFLKYYAWPETAVAFAIGDEDEAGRKWCEKGGFVDRLRARMKQVHCFFPAVAGQKDFNDLVKARLVKPELFRLMLRSRMRRTKVARRGRGETFLSWCKKQAVMRADEVGMAAYLVVRDKQRPKGCSGRAVKAWQRHWEKTASPEHRKWLRAAWAEWRATTRKPL